MANNFSVAQNLLREAERCLDEAKRCFAEGDWNFSIRRAQECVELALKSLLKAIGVEIPKRHDVGIFVVEQLRAANIAVDASIAERVISASERLAQQRAPAFYWEVAFDRKDAEAAVSDAEFVYSWAQMLVERIKGDA